MKTYRQNQYQHPPSLRQILNHPVIPIATLHCRQTLRLELQPQRKQGIFAQKRKQRRVNLAADPTLTLYSCFKAFNWEKPEHEYVFAADGSYPRQKSVSTLPRTDSQSSLREYYTNKKQQQRHQQMFIVQQQVGESLQSQSKQLQKIEQQQTNDKGKLQMQIKNNLNSITTKYLRNVSQPKKQDQAQAVKENQPSNSQERFSFAQSMKQGMMAPNSYQWEIESLQIAGDQQIEGEKRLAREMAIPTNDQLSSLSSILSGVPKDEGKKQAELDSIKQEIEKMSECLPSEYNNRVYLNDQAKQHELNSPGLIQISQRELQPNKSQYFVKYNLRFLDQKDKHTEVVRISPLRFRKKQDVVRHLVTTKLVEKESNSINRP